MAWALGMLVVGCTLAAGVVALLGWAQTGCWPRRSRLALVPAGGLLVGVIVLAVVLVPQLDDARELPECDSFVFSEADWRSSDEDRRLASAWGIAECDTFQGATGRAVKRRLGQPSTEGPLGPERYHLQYARLALFFVRGVVVNADAGVPGE